MKSPNVIDEHSRLYLSIRVARHCKAKDVAGVLEESTSFYHAPAFTALITVQTSSPLP